MLWLVVVGVLWFTLPSLIIQARLNGATVTLDKAVMEIDSDTNFVLQPTVAIFASRQLLQLPLISYTASIQPFVASVFIQVLMDSGSGMKLMEIELGQMDVNRSISIDSNHDVRMSVSGAFTITKPEILGQVVNGFIQKPTMPVKMTATVNVQATVWGWMPMYFPGISIEYTQVVKAMNNFRDKLVTLDKILTATGEPSKMNVLCSALIYNPSPVTLIVHARMQMRVAYQSGGMNYTVGRLKASDFRIESGDNYLNGTLEVTQDDKNHQAIIDMITAYMGGRQTGFGPAATKPFLVSIWDDGKNSADSQLLRESLKGLDMSLDFRPQPIYFLNHITADVTMIGSIIHGSLYESTVTLFVKNPLPVQARVDSVYLKAYYQNLNGNLLYKFVRNADTLGGPKIVPASAAAMVSFKLYISEVIFPWSAAEIFKLARDAADKQITVGVVANITMIVGDGYKQQVNYENNALTGEICYHLTLPNTICGATSQLGALRFRQSLLHQVPNATFRKSLADNYVHHIKVGLPSTALAVV
jgi:hypothetical protein